MTLNCIPGKSNGENPETGSGQCEEGLKTAEEFSYFQTLSLYERVLPYTIRMCHRGSCECVNSPGLRSDDQLSNQAIKKEMAQADRPARARGCISLFSWGSSRSCQIGAVLLLFGAAHHVWLFLLYMLLLPEE